MDVEDIESGEVMTSRVTAIKRFEAIEDETVTSPIKPERKPRRRDRLKSEATDANPTEKSSSLIQELDSSTSTTIPTRTLANLRQKIQSRVQRAKEQAEQEHVSDSRTRLKFLRDKLLTSTRFDQVLEEDSGIENAVLKVLQRRRETQKAERKGVERELGEEELSPIDFFTRVWDDRDEPEVVEPQSTSGPEISSPLYPSLTQEEGQQQEEAVGIGSRLRLALRSSVYACQRIVGLSPSLPPPPPPPPPPPLTPPLVEEPQPGTSSSPREDLLPPPPTPKLSPQKESPLVTSGQTSPTKIPADEEAKGKKVSSYDLIPAIVQWEECPNNPPFLVPPAVRVRWEQNILHYPSMKTSARNSDGCLDQRNVESEGLHVGPKLGLNQRNKNKIENRLRIEKSLKFLEEDETIRHQSRPYRDPFFRRPDFRDDEWADRVTASMGLNLCRGLSGEDRYQLDVNIHGVMFTHHHLFSVEHVLASRLTQLYDKYCQQTQKDVMNVIDARLNILTSAIESVNLERVDSSTQKRLEGYVHEIRHLRKMKDEEESLNRSLLKNILNVWKQVKELRSKRGYTNTNVTVQINKVEPNFEEDRRVWKEEIHREFEEEKLIHKVMVKLREISTVNGKKAKRKGKKKKRRRKSSDEDDEDEGEIVVADDESTVPLKKFDRVEVLRNIRQKAMDQRRRPGEPKLFPVLSHSAVVTDLCLPKDEQQRRSQTEKLKIFVRILFNGKEACRTAMRELKYDFSVEFAQIYNLRVYQKPTDITLEVCERRSWNLRSNALAQIYLPIPCTNVTAETVTLDERNFSSNTVVHHNHTGIGSGGDVHLGANYDEDVLLTSGSVRCSVCWGTDQQGKVLFPDNIMEGSKQIQLMQSRNALASIGTAGIANQDQLRLWLREARVDPNDPSNGAFLHLLDPSDGSIIHPPKYFRLNQLQEEFDFVSDDEIINNPRFKLLRLRGQEVPEFQGMTMIPINEREISLDVFDAYNRRQAEEKTVFEMDDFDSHRARVQKFLAKICEKIIKLNKEMLHKKVLENIVVEEQIPDIKTLSLAMLRIAEPLRPLRPVRKESKKVPSQLVGSPNVTVLVNVARGFNVPIRRNSQRTLISPSRHWSGGVASPFVSHVTRNPQLDLQPLVRPFVEISFQRSIVKTNTAEGPNPTWNEALQLPLHISPNDIAQDRVHRVKDVLYLNLFDEVRVDILEDERDRDVRVHERIERHWLGVLRIPFTTLYFNSRIEGTFKVETPPVLLGYSWNPGSSTYIAEGGPLNADTTYISLFITLDPKLPLPESIEMKFDGEDPRLQAYAENWLGSVRNSCFRRIIKTSAINYDGQTVFMTRYIHPLNPPQELTNLNLPTRRLMELLARFVSLIPHHQESVFLPGICDIWTSCDRTFAMMSASQEEHAVLLCNYFLHLNQRAWLAFGTAVPEGPTAFVLSQEGTNWYLWRSSTGECFNVHDNFAPILSLDTIVNEHNIWVNLQSYRKPSQMSFNVSKSNLWKPFFGKAFPHPGLRTYQPNQLTYVPTIEDYAQKLQDRIERTLREQVMNWRCRHRTPWNRHCNQALRKILPKLEQMRCHLLEGIDPIQEELNEILATYKVNGFPIDMPYTDVDRLSEAVFATGVHSFEHPDNEFSLAVYVHPYPSNVVAVWIYVAALSKR